MPGLTYNTRGMSGGGGGMGTVTEVDTGTGLTGGPITTSGTVSFADIDDMMILANISGESAPPIPNTLSDIIDETLGDIQGSLIYRDYADWAILSPGTAGQLLQTQGASANPIWVSNPSRVVATDPVWQVGGTSFPVTDVPAVSPWSSNANIDTGTSVNYYYAGPDVNSSSFTLSRDYGSQVAGIYKITFSCFTDSIRPIITVTEVNTSLSIGTFDAYYPGGESLTTGISMYFTWAATGDMAIQFSCPTKNPDSSDYALGLTGIVQLEQVG